MKVATGVVAEQPERAARSLQGITSCLGKLVGNQDTRRGLLAILDQGIISGLNFATSSLIALATGSYGLGVAHLALILVIFVTNIQGELVTAPFTIYRSRRQGDQLAVYCGSVLLHHAVLTLLGGLALLVFLALLEAGLGPTHMAGALWALLIAAPFYLLHNFLRHFSFACFRFQAALAMDIVAAVLQLSLLMVLLYRGTLTVPAVFLVMGASAAVASLVWFTTGPAEFRFEFGRWGEHWRENWVFGRWSLCSHVIGCAMTYVLPWLLSGVHGESITGQLAACGKLSALAATFVLGIAHFLTPRAVSAFTHQGIAGLNRVLTITGLVFMTTIGGFCGVVWVTGDWLMITLFGADFANTGSIVVILSLSVLMNSMAVLAGNGLWAMNRPQHNLIGDLAAMLATLAVALMWVNTAGALGIAWAILVGGGVGAVVRGITFWIVARGSLTEVTER